MPFPSFAINFSELRLPIRRLNVALFSDEKMNLPSGSYQWNKAILGSFKKGAAAHQSGSPIEACPYDENGRTGAGLSRVRSFIAAWRDGWRWSASGKA